MSDITITTTDGLEGQEVTEYLGVVLGEAIIGANVVSDIAAGIRDVVGGRNWSYEKKIETGRTEAIKDIQSEAEAIGADAVIGASFDYEEMAEGMLWINLSGTAVTTLMVAEYLHVTDAAHLMANGTSVTIRWKSNQMHRYA